MARRFYSYEVHYLNDNFDLRVVTFKNKKSANEYRRMLVEHADYLYGVTTGHWRELLEKREADYVADGSYKNWDWVKARKNNELFATVVSALVEYEKSTNSNVTCDIVIDNKKYVWNGSHDLHIERNYGMEEYIKD